MLQRSPRNRYGEHHVVGWCYRHLLLHLLQLPHEPTSRQKQIREQEELRLAFVRRVVFDRCGCSRSCPPLLLSRLHRSMFPSYHNRKVATGRGRFPTWDAVTYVWRCTSRSEEEEERERRGAQERVALMPLLRREGMVDRLSEEARRQRSSSRRGERRRRGEERSVSLLQAAESREGACSTRRECTSWRGRWWCATG